MKEYDIYPYGDSISIGGALEGFDISRLLGPGQELVVKWEQERVLGSNVNILLDDPSYVVIRYYDLSYVGHIREKIIGYDVNAYPIVCVNLKYEVVRPKAYVRLFGDVEASIKLFSDEGDKTLISIDGNRFAEVDKEDDIPPTEEEVLGSLSGKNIVGKIDVKNGPPSYSGLGDSASVGELEVFEKGFVYWNVFTKEDVSRFLTTVFYSSNFGCKIGGMSKDGTMETILTSHASYIDPDGKIGSVSVGNGYYTGPTGEARKWHDRNTNGWVVSTAMSKLGKGLYAKGQSFSNNSASWSTTGVTYFVKKEYCGVV